MKVILIFAAMIIAFFGLAGDLLEPVIEFVKSLL